MKNLNILYKTGMALMCCALLQACNTSTEPHDHDDNTTPGTVVLEFDNVAGPRDLTLNTGEVTNQHGEKFTVSTLKYFVSNIQLTSESGVVFTVPANQSYYLIDEANVASQKISLTGVPAGKYTKVSYIIGVDSLKSVAPLAERTGALDPGAVAEGMYWTWNFGYIFFMLEGSTSDKNIQYHIGGFGGLNTPTINNIRRVTLSMEATKIDSEHSAEVHITADITKVFGSPNPFKIADYPTVMLNPFSTSVSANYATMFEVDHVHTEEHAH